MTTPNRTISKLKTADMKSVRPKAIRIASEELIQAETLMPGSSLPLVVQPSTKDVNLVAWAESNKTYIEEKLLRHGAIVFRNFNVGSITEFEQFVKAVSGELIEYKERSSPRHEVGERVYTSTDYPANERIFPHNEHSYALTFPLKLFFFCSLPAGAGGETPLADCRRVFARINPRIRQRFIEKKWMYVRNFGYRFGLSWQTTFQTTDKRVVEEYCNRNRIQVEWKTGDRLRTYQIRPAVITHPRTSEQVWFNHATFFHISTLEPAIRNGLLDEFGEENLPNNTCYGDGTPIETSALDELRAAYTEELVSFSWRKGDLILLDNLLTAHARASYEGPRKILFAMSDPFTRTDF